MFTNGRGRTPSGTSTRMDSRASPTGTSSGEPLEVGYGMQREISSLRWRNTPGGWQNTLCLYHDALSRLTHFGWTYPGYVGGPGGVGCTQPWIVDCRVVR